MASRVSSRCDVCMSYLKNILKFLVSHIGLVSLVVGYTIIGAFTFAKLESHHEVEVKKNMSTVRRKVTDQLWDITLSLKMLEENEWSDKARVTLKDFEKSLIRAIKQDGWDGIEADEPKQWTFAGALFYSIILITTIGYGHIAPKTPWGKVVTIFYAIPGVPLMMLCLANIGDGMAHSFRFLYWKVCCYACTKRPKRKRRSRSRASRGYHHSGVDLRQRSSSFRRSARNSQRSGDSAYSDDCRAYRFEELDPRSLEESRSRHGSNRSTGRRDMAPTPSPRGSKKGHRSSQNSKGSNDQGDTRHSVLYNKYAMEEGEGRTDGRVPKRNREDRGTNRDRSPRVETKMRDSDDSDEDLAHQSRRDERDESPQDSPPRKGGRYPQTHLSPPGGRPVMQPRMDHYMEEMESEEEYEELSEGEEVIPEERPVPIWLGVMLVVAYILGGAVLFSGWEKWEFLDSVYFCFITLTTIGFGDFVPAQEKKANAELSIALCSLYLLFGIALLAMSFNLVQEEVINNVKSVAKRLGIIKEEIGEMEENLEE